MTPMQRLRARQWLGRTCAYAALVVVTLAVCFPLMWALSTSLKPKSELSTAFIMPLVMWSPAAAPSSR